MKVSYPCGTWPVVIEDIDAKNLTDDQVQFIGRSIANNAVVILKKQSLTVDDEVNFAQRIGTIKPFPSANIFKSQGLTDEQNEKFLKSVHRESMYIQSVTGKLNDDGLPGMHGMSEELAWHCGTPFSEKREDIIYLYGVYGTKTSQTIYLNSVESYNDLSQEWKDRIENLTLQTLKGYSDKYTKTGETFNIETVNSPYHPKVVHTNKAGLKCIFLPFNQISGFYQFPGTASDEQEVMDYLVKHMTQEKYSYTHNWDDGDVLVWDNWTGLHKRPAFAGMPDRLLHRMQFGIDNIKF